jgi:hypothetical protein
MIGMARDTWRAVLVVLVAVLLREIFAERPVAAPTPPVATNVATAMQYQPMQAWPQPQPPAWQPVQPDRPLRRVAAALTELGDSVIGVVRR